MSRAGVQNHRFEKNYYEVLGVSSSASEEDIRRTYRQKVLEAHPDKNPERREWAEGRIRELIVAYEILSDEATRRALDSFLRASGSSRANGEPFFFHRETPGCRALMILHCLVSGDCARGAKILDEMEEEYGRDFLYDYLAHEDYLDCLFLLAEHHIREKSFLSAAERLRAFYHQECQARHPRHYLDQVIDLLRDLYLKKLPKILDPALQVTFLVEAGEFRLSRKDELRRLRLLIDTAAASENRSTARAALQLLRELAPDANDLDELEARVQASVDRDAGRRRRQMRGRVGNTSGETAG